MRFKAGCSLRDLRPETVVALLVCDRIYAAHERQMTVTSVNDGSHMVRSRHYEGRAFDLRINDLPAEVREQIGVELQHELTPLGFDVVIESDHFHVEHDPK